MDLGRRLSSGPTLEEASRDAVADRHTRDARTGLDDFSRAVRQRNEVLANRHAVAASHNAEIAEIERASLNFHQDLPIGRLGLWPLDFDQRLDAGAPLRQLIGTHASPSLA